MLFPYLLFIKGALTLSESLHTFVIPPGSPSDPTHHTVRALLTCPSPHLGSQEPSPFTIEPQVSLSGEHTVGTQ